MATLKLGSMSLETAVHALLRKTLLREDTCVKDLRTYTGCLVAEFSLEHIEDYHILRLQASLSGSLLNRGGKLGRLISYQMPWKLGGAIVQGPAVREPPRVLVLSEQELSLPDPMEQLLATDGEAGLMWATFSTDPEGASTPAVAKRFLDTDMLTRERDMANALREEHPQYQEYFNQVCAISPDQKTLVYSAARGGTLQQYVQQLEESPPAVRLRAILELAEALQFCHAVGITLGLHPAICMLRQGSQNVLPKERDILLQLSTASHFSGFQPLRVFPSLYRAPELKEDAIATPASDVFAFGLMALRHLERAGEEIL